MSDKRERIGFVGLGNMGGPMARRLAEAGYDVMAFDIDADALNAAVEAGLSLIHISEPTRPY